MEVIPLLKCVPPNEKPGYKIVHWVQHVGRLLFNIVWRLSRDRTPEGGVKRKTAVATPNTVIVRQRQPRLF